MKKRILAIVLAITLLLCAAPQMSVTASATQNTFVSQDPVRYGWQILQKMENAENLFYVYETIVNGVANCESRIDFDSSRWVSIDELFMLMDIFRSDHPELFWFNSYSYYNRDGMVNAMLLHYTVTGEALENAKAAVEENAALLLTGLEDKSDYEISKLLHDRLAAFMSYEHTENDQTIYGALVERKAVCAGYARAYQYLLQRAGIPAWYVRGSSINSAGEYGLHAWTLVCLDGNWYHTDVTWDDQGNLDKIYYYYLNLTTELISENHFLDPFYADTLPDCSATAANYFTKEGLILSCFDIDVIVLALQENNLRARLLLTGDYDMFVAEWQRNLHTISVRLGLTTGATFWRVRQGKEIVLYITTDQAQPVPVAITFTSLPDNLICEAGTLDLTGGMLTVHYDDSSTKQVAITADMVSGFDPSVTGKQVLTVTYEGCKEYFTIQCNSPAIPPVPSGDLTGDNAVSNDDVIVLMWHILFPEENPLSANVDLNNDGAVNNDDVITLMWHILFPEENPLT